MLWDEEDASTDVRLRAGLLLARALAVRAGRHDAEEAASLAEMDVAIEAIRKQIAGFEEIRTSATTIVNGGNRILERARIMEEKIGQRLAALARACRAAAAGRGRRGLSACSASTARRSTRPPTSPTSSSASTSTALDLAALGDDALRAARSARDESAELFAKKGDAHERAHLERLRAQGLSIVDVAAEGGSLDDKVARTLDAMRTGVQVVYQAALRDGALAGHADFLRRVDGEPSAFGPWRYEVADTKLARSPKAKFLVQLAFYSHLLARAQGPEPRQMHVVLGDHSERAYRSADYLHYFRSLLERFLAGVQALSQGSAAGRLSRALRTLRAVRLARALRGEARRRRSPVPGRRHQTHAMDQAAGRGHRHDGAPRGRALPEARSPASSADTLEKLRSQAELQDEARRSGRRRAIVLPPDAERRRGFHRLPLPDEGDLFFDMEGDPLEDDGLEYLFGVGFGEGGAWTFRGFWAHGRAEERLAFEQFMDFVVERRRRHPGAHVYHYASYEESALKRLASLHATREVEVDELLRQGVLVDLYKVVREGIRISEDSYSIKAVERFYRPARAGDVKNAGASIVYYERWRETGEAQLLRDIEAYNRDDVESTRQLRDWLLSLRPAQTPWKTNGPDAPDDERRADRDQGAAAPSAASCRIASGWSMRCRPTRRNGRSRTASPS